MSHLNLIFKLSTNKEVQVLFQDLFVLVPADVTSRSISSHGSLSGEETQELRDKVISSNTAAFSAGGCKPT